MNWIIYYNNDINLRIFYLVIILNIILIINKSLKKNCTWFWIFLAILASSATLNFIALFLQTYSSNSVFCFINQLQLILLLPMLPNFMNKDIQSFITSLNYSLLSFGFLDLNFNSIFAGISLECFSMFPSRSTCWSLLHVPIYFFRKICCF